MSALNAFFPIISTLDKSALVRPLCVKDSSPSSLTFLKLTVFRAAHLPKACFPTSSTRLLSLPNVTEVNALHETNAWGPTVLAESRETFPRLAQLEKTEFPMVSTLFNWMLDSFVLPSNAKVPILTSESGKVTSSRVVYCLNVFSPIAVMPSVISTLTIELLYWYHGASVPPELQSGISPLPPMVSRPVSSSKYHCIWLPQVPLTADVRILLSSSASPYVSRSADPVTVIRHEAEKFPSSLTAVTVASPTASGVTTPAITSATSGLELLHAIVWLSAFSGSMITRSWIGLSVIVSWISDSFK